MSKLKKLQDCISTVREVLVGTESIQQLEVLVYIADNPGCSMADIERDIDVKYGTIARTMYVFGLYGKTVKGKKTIAGFDLIKSEPDLYERKRKNYFLTRKGEQLAKQLEEILS